MSPGPEFHRDLNVVLVVFDLNVRDLNVIASLKLVLVNSKKWPDVEGWDVVEFLSCHIKNGDGDRKIFVREGSNVTGCLGHQRAGLRSYKNKKIINAKNMNIPGWFRAPKPERRIVKNKRAEKANNK